MFRACFFADESVAFCVRARSRRLVFSERIGFPISGRLGCRVRRGFPGPGKLPGVSGREASKNSFRQNDFVSDPSAPNAGESGKAKGAAPVPAPAKNPSGATGMSAHALQWFSRLDSPGSPPEIHLTKETATANIIARVSQLAPRRLVERFSSDGRPRASPGFGRTDSLGRRKDMNPVRKSMSCLGNSGAREWFGGLRNRRRSFRAKRKAVTEIRVACLGTTKNTRVRTRVVSFDRVTRKRDENRF
jgi:hypothetical protein